MSSFLVRRLAHHAHEQPDQPALATSSRRWTWRELDDASRDVADALADVGARAETVVVVAMSRGPEVAFAVAGARRLGAVPAIVDPTDVDQALALCERLRPAALVVRASDPAARLIATRAPVVMPIVEIHGATPVGVTRLVRCCAGAIKFRATPARA